MTPVPVPTLPLEMRCLSLTGTFETGVLVPHCWSALSGDFDGQGISFSCLQWNFGQRTLQPLLLQMIKQHPDEFNAAFQECGVELEDCLGFSQVRQMAFCRDEMQYPVGDGYAIEPCWAEDFKRLGQTPEWQAIALASVGTQFADAKFLMARFQLQSDRAAALCFDCVVQNGGINQAARKHIDAEIMASGGKMFESDRLVLIAKNIAAACNPRWSSDVFARKMAIATGKGRVHGLDIDLANYGLA